MTKNRMEELSYYLFFALMIFAKGIGLDSGSRLYYVLSGAACICVGVKLVVTKYKVWEILAMALLCAIAFMAYRNSGRLGIVLSVLTIIGLKDMDMKKLFRMGAMIYGCSFAFTVTAAKFGIIGNPLVVHDKGGMELIRWGMGYSTGNVFHVSYFMLAVLLCYTWGKNYGWKRLLGLMAGNLLVFLYTLSYTGVLVTAFYLLLNYYAIKRRGLNAAERIICQLPLPLCLLFSFSGPFLLKYPAVKKLDSMLQARLTYSAYYLQNQPITLLGTRMENVPNFWVIMDNGYVYFFMTFGVAAFVLFCAGYAVVIGRYSGIGKCFAGKGGKRKCQVAGEEQLGRPAVVEGMAGGTAEMEGSGERLPELAMIFSFLLYGIMEQFLSNAFMNFSLLFLAEVLFGRGGVTYAGERVKDGRRRRGKEERLGTDAAAKEKFGAETAGGERIGTETAGREQIGYGAAGKEWIPDVKEAGRKGRYFRGLACGVTGLVLFMAYYFAVPVKEYICVPVGTLNFVGAQSIQINAGGKEDEKKELQKKMRAYGEALEDPDILRAALHGTGMEDRLSAEELAAALEYSIPVSMYSGEGFDTFRVRLLELYYDITEDEYRELLWNMVALVQEKESGQYSVAGSVYGEKIGKSFGDDRIEHMSKDKDYKVEKAGNIVKMEHFRDSVFFGVFGMAVTAAVWMAVCRKGEWMRFC